MCAALCIGGCAGGAAGSTGPCEWGHCGSGNRGGRSGPSPSSLSPSPSLGGGATGVRQETERRKCSSSRPFAWITGSSCACSRCTESIKGTCPGRASAVGQPSWRARPLPGDHKASLSWGRAPAGVCSGPLGNLAQLSPPLPPAPKLVAFLRRMGHPRVLCDHALSFIVPCC